MVARSPIGDLPNVRCISTLKPVSSIKINSFSSHVAASCAYNLRCSINSGSLRCIGIS
jgi:hypothetical protein